VAVTKVPRGKMNDHHVAAKGSPARNSRIAAAVFWVMAAMGFDQRHHLPAGIAITLLIGVPLIVLAVRSMGSGGGGGGGGFSGGDFSGDFSGDGD
jgi:hypothetical protein